MRSLHLALAIAAALLQGCAYLTHYKSDLGDPELGLSVDAKQRVILRGPKEAYFDPDSGERFISRRICAEPSPDALAAIGASLGGSFLSGPESGQLAAALGESASSIGLRTTSIQLMRDAMYRACEAYLSGGISHTDYTDLQAHSQNLIVGMLAIEQLTGAVQAQQVSIVTNAGSGSGDDATEAEQAWKDAKLAVNTKRGEVTTAAAELEAEKASLKTKQDNLKKAEAADPPPDATELDALKEDLKATEASVREKRSALLSKQGDLQIEEAHERIKKDNFNLAKSRVRATAAGSASFSNSDRSTSDKTSEILAFTVADIVSTIMSQSAGTHKCINLLSRETFAKLSERQQTAILEHCSALLNAEKQARSTQEVLRIQQRQKFLSESGK